MMFGVGWRRRYWMGVALNISQFSWQTFYTIAIIAMGLLSTTTAMCVNLALLCPHHHLFALAQGSAQE